MIIQTMFVGKGHVNVGTIHIWHFCCVFQTLRSVHYPPTPVSPMEPARRKTVVTAVPVRMATSMMGPNV